MNDLADIGPPYGSYSPKTTETILLVAALTVKIAPKEIQKAVEYD
jgi:hypothetical protein